MAFRVKDLMINVAPPEGAEPQPGIIAKCLATNTGQLALCACFGGCGCSATHTGCGHTYGCGCTATVGCGCSATVGCGCSGTPTPQPPRPDMWYVHAMHGGDPGLAAAQLAAMKAQLKDELAEIERHETSLNKNLQPQTVEQIEDLQGKLREALSELDRRKAELKKQ